MSSLFGMSLGRNVTNGRSEMSEKVFEQYKTGETHAAPVPSFTMAAATIQTVSKVNVNNLYCRDNMCWTQQKLNCLA